MQNNIWRIEKCRKKQQPVNMRNTLLLFENGYLYVKVLLCILEQHRRYKVNEREVILEMFYTDEGLHSNSGDFKTKHLNNKLDWLP